jgi:multidrug efflux pump subunit AcrB
MPSATDHVHDAVDAYLHDLLSPADRDHVEGHCAECPACQAALADAQRRLEALRTLRTVEASADVIQRTQARLDQAAASRLPRPLAWLRARTLAQKLALGAAAAGLLIGLLNIYYLRLAPSPYDLRVLGHPAPADGDSPKIVVSPKLVPADGDGPTIAVEASYPGADARTVAETIAAPIEQQVNGVEGMMYMSSTSANDGTYNLTVTFNQGVDLDMAQVLVQNRINLAVPKLPDVIKATGVTTRKRSADILMGLALHSPKGRYDQLYLGNYALCRLKDELARVKGVGDVSFLGPRDYSMRIWLDPERMASLEMTASDVVKAIREQNVEVAAGRLGQPPVPAGATVPFQLPINAQGRLSREEEFEKIIVKLGKKGEIVYLRDVVRPKKHDKEGRVIDKGIELGANSADACVTWNGRPAAPLGIYGLEAGHAKDVSAAVRKRVEELRNKLPEGLRLEVVFDFAEKKPAECFRLDVTLPDMASARRTRKVLEHCANILRETKGVKDILSLDGAPLFHAENEGCLLAGLAPEPGQTRGQILSAVRARVRKEIKEAEVRVCDLSSARAFTLGGYPLDLAISGPDRGRVRELADQLAKGLRNGEKLTDVFASRDSSPRPFLKLEIDRAKAKDRGVDMTELYNTLGVYTGSVYVNDFFYENRNWQVNVQADPNFRAQIDSLSSLKVRDKKGNLISLEAFVQQESVTGPTVVNRLDMQPMAEVTANLAPGVTAAQARRLVEDAIGALQLPKGYRVTWLHELPAGP